MTTKRRGCCSPIALAVVLGLLFGGLIVTDRIAHDQVEKQVAMILQRQMSLETTPTVTIHGVPFLTQVLVNRFDRIDLSGRGITAGTPERPIMVDSLELELGRVTTAQRYHQITAGTLEGTATVTWAELSRALGSQVSPEAGGRVRVDLTADLYGQQAEFVVSARPVLNVATQEVSLAEPRVIIARYQVPDQVVERIAAEYAPPVPITLPMTLRASSLTVHADHLALGIDGNSVKLVG